MKLNPIKWLLNDEDKRPPVLLAVTPPRTGERTLLGVENMLGSIAVPEPFSLELAGDMDGVTLHGPLPGRPGGARPDRRPLPPGADTRDSGRGRPAATGRGRAGVEHDPAGRRPRVRPPAHLPGRRPARPRLRPPHRPHGRAVEPERGGARGGAAAAALPGTRLVGGPSRKGPQAARRGAAGPLLHLPDQAPSDRRRDDGRPGRGGPGRRQGLPVGAGGGDLEGRTAGRGRRPGPGRRRLGLAPLEEGPKARPRPAPHQGEGLPHRLRRRASGDGGPARRHGAAAGQGASRNGGRRLPPLRQPRRGAVQDGKGAPRRPRPVDAAPRRPRILRQAQRRGRPRGGLPLAPAGGAGRDAPGGPRRGQGAAAHGPQRQRRRPRRRHHHRDAPEDSLPRRPAPPTPPLRRPHPHGQVHPDAPHRRPQDAGEGGGQGRTTPSSSSILTPTWWGACWSTSPRR